MTEHVPASEIERIVGVERHPTRHSARIQAEAWPCANYTAPVTCLHAGTTTPCDWCREAGAGAEQRGAERVKAAVDAACTKAEALTQEAMGHVSEHWRGRDFADGLDDGIETTTGLVRTALADADTTARDRASIEELVERSSLGTPAAKAARASVSDEDAARIVARARKIDAGAHDRDVAAEALEAAAEATVMEWRPVFYEDDNDEWANDKVARWLRARAAAVRQGGEHRG